MIALWQASVRVGKSYRIFTPQEGGAQHCQRDFLTRACDVVADWLEEKLKY